MVLYNKRESRADGFEMDANNRGVEVTMMRVTTVQDLYNFESASQRKYGKHTRALTWLLLLGKRAQEMYI